MLEMVTFARKKKGGRELSTRKLPLAESQSLGNDISFMENSENTAIHTFLQQIPIVSPFWSQVTLPK